MAKDAALQSVPIVVMVNKIDLIDDMFAEGKDFNDLDQKK